MFDEEIRTKQDISYISICSFSILYNSKFILMAMFLGTNVVICNEGSLYIVATCAPDGIKTGTPAGTEIGTRMELKLVHLME